MGQDSLTDLDIKNLMEMQSKGLDANGKPLLYNDPSLNNIVNRFLNRQKMAPTMYNLKANSK